MRSGTNVGEVKKFPVLAEIVTPKSDILKMGDDDKHTLEKIGAWLTEGKKVYVQEIVDATFNDKPCRAVKFKAPNPRKPGDWLEFHLVVDDVELQELEPTSH